MIDLEEMTHDRQVAILEVFDNPRPERDYRVVHTTSEFTSVCPKTGLPDFATITVDYVPDQTCLELKALKMYFYSFRQQGIYYEAVINRILDDLVSVCQPRRMMVTGDFNLRGGFGSVITAEYVAAST